MAIEPLDLLTRTLPNAARLSAAQVFRRLCRLALIVMAARILGPATFGTYALFLAAAEIAALVCGGGLVDYIVREAAREPSRARELAGRVAMLRWVYLTILNGMVLGTLLVLHSPGTVILCAAFLGVSLFARVTVESTQALARARGQYNFLLALEICYGILLVVTGTLSMWAGFGLVGLCLAEAVAGLLGALATLAQQEKRAPVSTSHVKGLMTLARETASFSVYPLVVNIYDRFDVFLLGKFLGAAAIGFYSLPYRILAAFQIIPYGIMGTLLPVVTERGTDQRAQHQLRRSMTLLFCVSLCIVIVTTLTAEPLIYFITGKQYGISASALRLLIWAIVPMFLNHGLNTLLLATGNEKFLLRASIGCAFLNIAANVLLIPQYSFFACAAITVFTEATLLAQNLSFARKVTGAVFLPDRFLRTAAGFLVALFAGFRAQERLGPLAASLIALLLFVAYLFAAGGARFRSDVGEFLFRRTALLGRGTTE